MTGRFWSSVTYRFGFNGQEKDDEIYGEKNATTAEFWEYDTRLGRRWNLDPKPQILISDYACFGDNPISFSDILGDSKNSTHLDPKGKIIAVYNDGDKSIYKHQTAKTKKEVDAWREKFNNTSGNGIKIGETLREDDFFVTNDKKGGYDFNKVPNITINTDNLTVTGTVTPREGKEDKIYNADAQRLLNWGNELFMDEVSSQGLVDFYSQLSLLKKMSSNYKSATASTGAGCLDFKESLGLPKWTPIKAGVLSDGKPIITTLRAVGNMTFGSNIELTRDPLLSRDFYYKKVMQKVGAYNQSQNKGNGYNSGYPFYGEHTYSGNYIFYGYYGRFFSK